MRVLVNALGSSVGGGATAVRPLVAALLAVDGGAHQYELIGPADIIARSDPGDPRVSVGRDFMVKGRGERLFQEYVRLPLVVGRARADVLLTLSSPAVLGSRVPQVVLFRNAAPFTPALLREYRRLEGARMIALRQLSVLAAGRATRLVFISRAQRDTIVPFLGAKAVAERADCVYLGRSLEFSPKMSARSPAVWRRYGLEAPYVLCVSQFYKYKNLVELVEGFALAAPHLPRNVLLALAGAELEPDYVRRVRAAVARTGLGGRVRFTGAVPHAELPGLYAGAALFVFPSTCESFPNILIEALASGVPTLASNIEPMPELAGRGARYFDPYSAWDVGRAIAELWNDPEGQRELVAEGLARVQRFSWEATARGLLNAIQAAVH